jgi:hypothetical protein
MKGRAKRDTGGSNLAKEDLDHKNMDYTNESNVPKEAEERKRGGRAKKKDGGKVPGADCKMNAGRKPRKSGGRANPFQFAARNGTPAPGRKLQTEFD